MIYDVVIGQILPTKNDYNYIKGDYVVRTEQEEITDYKNLVSLIAISLKDFTTKTTENIDEALNVLSEFTILKKRLEDGEENINVDETIRELLSTLAFVGIDMYIIRRPDLSPADELDSRTRAYMIDKNDKFFPTINRVVTGHSIAFNESRDANISTVIMNFLEDIRFNDIVEESLNLNNLKEQFEDLQERGMGWSLNTDDIIKFLSDYGYKFIVVV